MRGLFIFLAGAATLALAINVEAASFDCKLAANRIDKAICASEQVSVLDSEMSAAYADTLRIAVDTNEKRADQRAWIAEKRNKCPDEACLIDSYKKRIAVLRKPALPNEPVPSATTVGANPAVGNRFPELDARFISLRTGFGDFPVVALRVPPLYPTGIANLSVRCAWQGKQFTATNSKDQFRPGDQASVTGMPKWLDGSAMNPDVIQTDVQAGIGSSRAKTDPNVPSCIVESFSGVAARPVLAQGLTQTRKFPQLDARFLAINGGYAFIVVKIAESETTWLTNVAVACSWRDKKLEAINKREMFSPGMRVGVEGDNKWSDGSPFDLSLLRMDRQVSQGESKTGADADVPSCVVTSFDRVNKDQAARNLASDPNVVNLTRDYADPVAVLTAAMRQLPKNTECQSARTLVSDTLTYVQQIALHLPDQVSLVRKQAYHAVQNAKDASCLPNGFGTKR